MNERAELKAAAEALRSNRPDTAAELLSGVLENNPGNLEAGWLMLQCRDLLRDRNGALEQLESLLRAVSSNPGDISRLGDWAYQRGYALDSVVEAWKACAAGAPESADTVYNLAYYLGLNQQYDAAIEAYRKAIRLGMRAPEEAELNIASIYMDHLGDNDRAVRHLQKARGLNPRFGAVYFNLGNLSERLGDREKAARYFEKCLELDPKNDPVLARLADAHRFESADDPLLERMVTAASTTTSRDLHFSLGRAYDRLADYGKAWGHFERANTMDAEVFPPYLPEQAAGMFDRIGSVCTKDWLGRFEGSSRSPVFICGMYRTGTTLLEQILGAHPAFTAGGESEFFPRLLARNLPYFPDGLDEQSPGDIRPWRAAYDHHDQALTGNETRLTDKRPDNFLCAGLIKAVLPDARFVVTERDDRDTAVSIFATRLGARHNYATRLEHIRHYIGLHHKLVDHWENVLGDDLVRVRYEDLVRNPRDTLEGLLGRLGEPWDEKCLAFHDRKSAVRTASVWQVREPLHARSVGRWRNYSTPVEAAFGS